MKGENAVITMRTAGVRDANAIARIMIVSMQYAYADILPAEAIAGISSTELTEEWQERLQRPGTRRIMVAERDGAIVGFVSWSIHEREMISAILHSIYTSPDQQGKGVGTQLLAMAEAAMIAAGALSAKLDVLVENQPTRTFYERHGWREVADTTVVKRHLGIDMMVVQYRKYFG